MDDLEEETEVANNGEKEKQWCFATLKNKVLDRLAETLARFKTEPKGTRKSFLDPKHVSSTMMNIYQQLKKVEFLCTKNEGLNQGDTSDTGFLNSWKLCIKNLSKKGEE